MTPSLSWNCISFKRNRTVRKCELAFVYSRDHSQKKRVIWMRSAEHCAEGQERADASAATMTRPSGMAFSRFGAVSW